MVNPNKIVASTVGADDDQPKEDTTKTTPVLTPTIVPPVVVESEPTEKPPKAKEEPKPKEKKGFPFLYVGSVGVLFSLTLLLLAVAYKSTKS